MPLGNAEGDRGVLEGGFEPSGTASTESCSQVSALSKHTTFGFLKMKSERRICSFSILVFSSSSFFFCVDKGFEDQIRSISYAFIVST